MTDEFDKLGAALTAPPTPDAGAKARALRLALENFDRHQETLAGARPMSDRPEPAGFLTGVRKMIRTMTTRQALAATASLATIGVAIAFYPALQRAPLRPAPLPAKVIGVSEPGTMQPTDSALAGSAGMPKAERDQAPLSLDETGALQAPAIAAEPMLEFATELQNAPAALGKSNHKPLPQAAPLADLAPAATQPETAIATAEINTEAFAGEIPNPVKITAEEPVSTFSIDVDTASYAVIRSSLTGGTLPPSAAVRIEEMVNYFPYDYAAPAPGEAPFRASVSLFQTPWNADTRLLRIGLQGELPAVDNRPPLNLVFLIDTSGSMEGPKKLPLLKQSFRLMLSELRPQDRVAIVTYAGAAGLVLEPTEAADRATILAALDRLDAGGATAGAEGLRQAYQVAETMAGEGRIGRILLATDGDFNVGIADPEALKAYVGEKRDSGIYLSVLGFGRGNLDDATMQALAQNGNGTAAYIDTLSEAQKVLVDQLSGALFPIADDVKIQIEFNPAAVAEYRLIGYETRRLAREDFNNDRVDAGEIGAGHQVTALYEITPVGSPVRFSDPLRYATAQPPADASELGFLKLRYKTPGAETSTLIETPIPLATGATATDADTDARFAAAIAGFGQLLTGAKYLGGWGWDDAIALANGAKGDDPYGYRGEAVQLMRLAESLAN